MEILSVGLGRLTALCMIASVSELLLPSGGLKKSVRFVAGLMAAEMILQLALSIPALFGR